MPDAVAPGAARAWAGRLLRLAVAVLPVAWLARRVDPAAALGHAATVGWAPVAGAVALWAAVLTVGAVRWCVLLRAYGAGELPPFRRMLKNVFIAGYFNVLPSGLAGDVFRSLRVRHVFAPAETPGLPPQAPTRLASASGPADAVAPDPIGAALTVLAMERIVGLIALLAIVAVAALTGPGIGAGPTALAFRVGCASAAALSGGLLFVPWILARWPEGRALVARLPIVRDLLPRVAAARRPAGVALGIALSFGTQGLALLIAELLLYRLATPDQLLAAARTIPFAILLAYVPITPGAVAQREAVYTLFLGLAGISADRAVAVAVLSFTAQLTVAALGGLLYGAERLGWIAVEPRA